MHAPYTKATHDALNRRVVESTGGGWRTAFVLKHKNPATICLRKSPPTDHYKTAAAGEVASQTALQIHQG